MRTLHTVRRWRVVIAAAGLGLVPGVDGLAARCGDVDGTNTITVTDGVNLLRAAAGLRTCELRSCDIDLDGRVGVTDGVRALRAAADIPTPIVCIDDQVHEQIARVRDLNAGVTGAGAAATFPCADGGSVTENESSLEFVDCRSDGRTRNGTYTLQSVGNGAVRVTFQDYTLRNETTGEAVTSTGDLRLTVFSDAVDIEGSVERRSSVLGVYRDDFEHVVTDTEGHPLAGSLLTEVASEGEAFGRMAALRSYFLGPVAVLATTTFSDGSIVGEVRDGDAVRLCAPCDVAASCDPSLACLPCASSCTGATERCALPFDVLIGCEDGEY